jgi:hypothetical protein
MYLSYFTRTDARLPYLAPVSFGGKAEVIVLLWLV